MIKKFIHLFPKKSCSVFVVGILDLLKLSKQDGLGLAVVVGDVGIGPDQERHCETVGLGVHDNVVFEHLLSGNFVC